MARQGRPARLSRDTIAAAAEHVVRTEGSAALSMRRVARELGSSPMALYRHVADKEDLLRLVLDRIAPRLERPEPPAEPRDRVLAVGRAVHAWMVAHPWAIDVLPAHLMGWSTAWIAEDIVAALIAGGLAPRDAARGYQIIWAYLVGELTLAHADAARRADRREPIPPADDDGGRDLPVLASLADTWPAVRERDHLDRGLTAIVDGLLGG